MISVFGSLFGDEEINEVNDSIRSQWVGMGKKVERFEAELCKKLDLPNLIMVNSGSNALYLALKLLDLPPGSEVILPTFTWVACGHSIMLAGCEPVFCDVELDSQNVSAELIKPHISSKTGAIMVVHYAGLPVEMEAIIDLGLPVIEDAAHAVVSTLQGKNAGGIGVIGVFSFDSIKNIAAGEAGALTTRDPVFAKRAKNLRYCGIAKSGFESAMDEPKSRWWEYAIQEVFPKMLPSDLSGALALAQLSKIDTLQKTRKGIWDRYQEAFSLIDWITCPLNAKNGDTHSFFTFFIQVPHRNELADHLLKQGIYTTLRYHPLHMNPIYQSNAYLPNSEKLNQTGLNIPLHPRLTEKQVETVISAILNFPPKVGP